MPAPTESKLTDAWNAARHGNGGWPKFLSGIRIAGLRGWDAELVEFRYPVVAIAGVNGAGKSTVLKAAAAAYRAPENGAAATYYPDDFFPKTPWEEVAGVSLIYDIRLGDQSRTITVRKPSSRWRGAPERVERATYFLDISRIQPANTQIGYGRTAQEVISRGTSEPLSADQVAQLSRTLGRKYEYARIERGAGKQVGVLSQNGVEYSNFHQGAGEDSILDLIALISAIPDYSLVVIDEVEASLHPQAQRVLITEFLDLAHRKRLQIIFSTHSPFVLEQLPSVARMFIAVDRDSKRKVLYGVSSDFALNLMDNERHEELDIYCEDHQAEYLIERILAVGAADKPDLLQRLRITPVGPASTVISLATIAAADKLPRKSVCVVDAEQSPGDNYMVLPGTQAPERELLEAFTDAEWTAVAERLGRYAGDVLDAKDAAMQIPNHHAWIGEIARLIGGTMRKSKVWEAVADVWVRDILGDEQAKKWCEPIVAAVPAHDP
ncbi:ATP-dependent endonuclease [Mycolicibacterium sp. OfavD-34-C]|uniref:ATP-dependent nuclease n=1 Tax=Mycolicibacterium sp. OfavD-34-C TaxID=2917746 RepID=UPI001EF72588|nr:AAA family ATPase [Mycolicibacterium sp. OfavD-34-C]MCG7583750.1 AAA family ATPase [Mycolicibacterium sp. OfavD-34-C]